jgi:D-alanyl-D-alanine carboxypeptidase
VHHLADTVAKGGGLMIGVGPSSHGEFHPEAIRQMKAAGAWLKVNGEAIYATRAREGARIDRIAAQVLEQTGVPSASSRRRPARQAGLHPRLRQRPPRHRPPPPCQATPEMRYSIGSISKQFTAAAILLLQEGQALARRRGRQVHPRPHPRRRSHHPPDLSHTSGYQDYWPEDYVMTPCCKPETAQQILDTWAKKPLDFEPGTQWQYSNTNFVIAGRIVEKVTGAPLMDFLTEHIFRPWA